MGSVWLGSLPDVLRESGYPVNVYPGWETRSRSSGGYDTLLGIQVHHTASSGRYPLNEMRYMWETASTKPIGAVYLEPNGTWTVGAAGATNTSGKGGPMVTSRGTVPLDAGNRFLLAIEAANPGDGTPWPEAQQDSYVKGCAALSRRYFGGILLVPGDCGAHFEWTSRKVDPAGSSRYAAGANKWNMTKFRADVVGALAPPTTPNPPLPGAPDMFTPIQPFRNSDTRAYGGAGLPAGVTHEFGLNPDIVPTNATAVAVNVAMLPAGAPGFLSLWPGPKSNPRPNTSIINAEAGGAHNGAAIVGCPAGRINVFVSTQAHIVIDVTGYWTP